MKKCSFHRFTKEIVRNKDSMLSNRRYYLGFNQNVNKLLNLSMQHVYCGVG